MARPELIDSPPALSDRLSEILQAVVEDYIASAEPVGSRTLTKRNPGIDLSPATVRNAMSDLEDLGYLSAPHASAGRVPTPLAFRVYVEKLAQRGRLSPREREQIQELVASPEGSNRDLTRVLVDTSRVLSTLSNQVSLVLFPRLDAVVFSHIEFVPVHDRTVLAVFVAKSGLIQQRVIDVDFALDRDRLRQISNYLQTLLDGKTLIEVRQAVLAAMHSERAAADEMMLQALTLAERTVTVSDAEKTMVIEGERNFLQHPEFADVQKMRRLFQAFEEKTLLLRLLDAAATRPNEAGAGGKSSAAVYFGADGGVRELRDLAVVMTSYAPDQGPAGQVGIVGPMRMDYSHVIPLVEFTADVLSKSFGAEPGESDLAKKK